MMQRKENPIIYSAINMKYVVETTYPYQFFPCSTEKEAKEKKNELRKKGIKASIVCENDNGNDFILE